VKVRDREEVWPHCILLNSLHFLPRFLTRYWLHQPGHYDVSEGQWTPAASADDQKNPNIAAADPQTAIEATEASGPSVPPVNITGPVVRSIMRCEREITLWCHRISSHGSRCFGWRQRPSRTGPEVP
jgi:hypothetical protein